MSGARLFFPDGFDYICKIRRIKSGERHSFIGNWMVKSQRIGVKRRAGDEVCFGRAVERVAEEREAQSVGMDSNLVRATRHRDGFEQR